MATGEFFDIATDTRRNFIRITMKGFWAEDTVHAYDRAIRAAADALAKAGCPRSEIVALVDARDLIAQSAAVIDTYKDKLSGPDRQPRRLATIVSRPLFKLQVKRIAMPNQGIFETEDEALAWLFADAADMDARYSV